MTNSSPTNPHLLISDWHDSRDSLDFCLEAQKHGVRVVTLPAHTTDELQPLDTHIFGILKQKYKRLVLQMCRERSGEPFPAKHLPPLSYGPFREACAGGRCSRAFQNTGICPFDPLLHMTLYEWVEGKEKPGEFDAPRAQSLLAEFPNFEALDLQVQNMDDILSRRSLKPFLDYYLRVNGTRQTAWFKESMAIVFQQSDRLLVPDNDVVDDAQFKIPIRKIEDLPSAVLK